MPAHWTYASFRPDSDLEQGDILQPTGDLRSLFIKVHPHFCDDKYLGFLIGTQTCDLVRRGGSPKAKYISVAVIRPLSQMLRGLIEHAVTPIAEGKFPNSGKIKAKQLLERIFNQNEQALGIFFLNEDADSGIGEAAVAMLRITVAIKSEHYDKLIASRTGRLETQFQAKLGWLLGNLYNRPATPDWAEKPGGKGRIKKMIALYIGGKNDAEESFGVSWIEDILIQEAKANDIELDSATADELEQLRPPAPLDRALAEVVVELRKVSPEMESDDIEKLQNRLKNSGKFRKLFSHSQGADSSN